MGGGGGIFFFKLSQQKSKKCGQKKKLVDGLMINILTRINQQYGNAQNREGMRLNLIVPLFNEP